MTMARKCWRPDSKELRCRWPRGGCAFPIASSTRSLLCPIGRTTSINDGSISRSGEIVRVEVEIWPTSMVFRKGHRIRLDIQPRDGVGSASYMHYHADYNTGTNTIYAGGERESYLLLPVIP